jgi:hypothetical protein
MKNRFMQTTVGTFLALLMLFGGTQLVSAQDGEGQERLEGVWRVTITPRNCVTGVPIPTAAFQALFTFHKGGTQSVSLPNLPITLTRSPGHGLWQREHGGGDYSFKFVHIRFDLATSAFLASQVARGTLRLSESGNEFTTNSSTTSFDVHGVIIPGQMSCSNAVGTRFE